LVQAIVVPWTTQQLQHPETPDHNIIGPFKQDMAKASLGLKGQLTQPPAKTLMMDPGNTMVEPPILELDNTNKLLMHLMHQID
jgi:hypothetical protein